MLSNFQYARKHTTAGNSLVEVIVAVACAVVIGGVAVMIYVNSLDLFRNNGAINASHEAARSVIDSLEKEIQSAISIPALVGLDRDIIDTSGPAPGVAFLRQSGPLRQVTATALTGTTLVQLDSGPLVKVGQRLLIPAYDIEGDVVGVNGNVVTLAAPLPADVKITSGTLNRNIIAIVTDLVTYLVIGGELREFQNPASNVYNLVATGFTEPTPFALPFNAVPGATPPSSTPPPS